MNSLEFAIKKQQKTRSGLFTLQITRSGVFTGILQLHCLRLRKGFAWVSCTPQSESGRESYGHYTKVAQWGASDSKRNGGTGVAFVPSSHEALRTMYSFRLFPTRALSSEELNSRMKVLKASCIFFVIALVIGRWMSLVGLIKWCVTCGFASHDFI